MLKTSTVLKLTGVVILGAFFLLLHIRPDLASLFPEERIRSWLEATGPFAPLVYMGIMASAVVISPIPSLPLDVLAGVFFGPWFINC